MRVENRGHVPGGNTRPFQVLLEPALKAPSIGCRAAARKRSFYLRSKGEIKK